MVPPPLSSSFLFVTTPSYYTPIEVPRGSAADGVAHFGSDIATTGPWSPSLQHGGPPSALLVQCAERAASAAGDDLVAMRLAAEFLGPVPVADLEVTTRVVRAARAAVLVEASIAAADRICLQGRVWLVRRADTSDIAAPLGRDLIVPPTETGLGLDFPYHDSIAWRSLTGPMVVPGPGRVWARPRRTAVPGEPLSGLQRAALIGDSAGGISSELDWDQWSFVNVDLDVHLSRPMTGEWLQIDARTSLGPAGAALARSTLSDVTGEVGTTSQTLVLARRR